MITLKCKLLEYSTLYSGKLLWGLDCELEELQIELDKLYKYIYLQRSLEESNDCERISINIQQKINNYITLLNKKRTSFCKNCN